MNTNRAAALIFAAFIVLTSALPSMAQETFAEKSAGNGNKINNQKLSKAAGIETKNDVNYVKGVWFTYKELEDMLSGGNFAAKFTEAAEKCKTAGITDIFVHVRPYCNSLCPSKYFPQINSAKG